MLLLLLLLFLKTWTLVMHAYTPAACFTHTMVPCPVDRSAGRDHLSVQKACVSAQEEAMPEWTWQQVTPPRPFR